MSQSIVGVSSMVSVARLAVMLFIYLQCSKISSNETDEASKVIKDAQCKFIPPDLSNSSELDIIIRDFVDYNSNVFAVNLWKKAWAREFEEDEKSPRNVLFSPGSIVLALSSLYPGAKEETAEEIKNVIAESFDDDLLIGFYARVLQKLREANAADGIELTILNRAFVERILNVKEEFQETLSTCFSSPFVPVDFKIETEKSRNDINEFVELETRGKIRDLLPPDSLSVDTRLVLTNVIYFNGDWANPFTTKSHSRTLELDFTSFSGEKTWMKFMNARRDYFFYKEKGVGVLGVPYKTGETVFYMIHPEDFAEFAENIQAKELHQLLDKATENVQEVDSYVPKFEMDYEYPVVDVLR